METSSRYANVLARVWNRLLQDGRSIGINGVVVVHSIVPVLVLRRIFYSYSIDKRMVTKAG